MQQAGRSLAEVGCSFYQSETKGWYVGPSQRYGFPGFSWLEFLVDSLKHFSIQFELSVWHNIGWISDISYLISSQRTSVYDVWGQFEAWQAVKNNKKYVFKEHCTYCFGKGAQCLYLHYATEKQTTLKWFERGFSAERFMFVSSNWVLYPHCYILSHFILWGCEKLFFLCTTSKCLLCVMCLENQIKIGYYIWSA